ncbi:hypothetical protein GGI21_003735 [Coemansia aciculifera]|uniref:Uncharacterized protein n=1 Tax=Coemansia aciculifera TaxID=417176 RepID=A0ACC1M8U8_9FUNG|nr:hypothetical protein IWW38_000719 [Coemansia aciculifera]KAJ2907591.1 hypothetical protein GGI21_003735 [Coemansia aciculifera]
MSINTSTASRERQLSRAFIGIHDKTPSMRILYVTSSIRDVLGFEPEEAVGQTAMWFIANGKAEEFRRLVGREVSEDSVLITKLFVRTRSGIPVYVRLLNFSCDNLAFNVCFVYSEQLEPPQVDHTPLPVELVHGQSELALRRHSLLRAHQESSRGMASAGGGRLVRACLMLEPIGTDEDSSNNSPMGPRVLFASNSFDRIVGIDASDVQGMPFLLLVAPQDVARAGAFLDTVKTAGTVVVDHFMLLANPHDAQARPVAVEIMAAGADSGAVMLCQLAKRNGPSTAAAAVDNDVLDGYMSLEEIISSDADTTDIGDVWMCGIN